MLVTKRDLKGQTKLLTVNWMVSTSFFSRKCLNAYLCQILRKCSWGKMLFERFWTVSLPTRNNQCLIILVARPAQQAFPFGFRAKRDRGTGLSVLAARAALLLAPFFARSLTLVPRTLLPNRTGTPAMTATFTSNGFHWRLFRTLRMTPIPDGIFEIMVAFSSENHAQPRPLSSSSFALCDLVCAKVPFSPQNLYFSLAR